MHALCDRNAIRVVLCTRIIMMIMLPCRLCSGKSRILTNYRRFFHNPVIQLNYDFFLIRLNAAKTILKMPSKVDLLLYTSDNIAVVRNY